MPISQAALVSYTDEYEHSQDDRQTTRIFFAELGLGGLTTAGPMLFPASPAWKVAQAQQPPARLDQTAPVGHNLEEANPPADVSGRPAAAEVQDRQPASKVTFTRRKPATITPAGSRQER